MDKYNFYTPEEIAEKLKITKYTVYEMIKRGDLNAHHIGKHLRITEEQFEEYLQKAKGLENCYKAHIQHSDEETTATVDNVTLYVKTDLKGDIRVGFRAEDIILSKEPIVSSARNMLKGKVTNISEEPSSVTVTLDAGIPISAKITKKSLEKLEIKLDSELYAIFKTMAVLVFK